MDFGQHLVSAIAAVQVAPDLQQMFLALAANDPGFGQLGPVMTKVKTSATKDAKWGPVTRFDAFLGSPTDSLATGQLPDGGAQIFAATGREILTRWTTVGFAGYFWSAQQGFPEPPS